MEFLKIFLRNGKSGGFRGPPLSPNQESCVKEAFCFRYVSLSFCLFFESLDLGRSLHLFGCCQGPDRTGVHTRNGHHKLANRNRRHECPRSLLLRGHRFHPLFSRMIRTLPPPKAVTVTPSRLADCPARISPSGAARSSFRYFSSSGGTIVRQPMPPSTVVSSR